MAVVFRTLFAFAANSTSKARTSVFGLDVGGVLIVRRLGRLQLFEQPSFNPIGVTVEFLEGLILLKPGSFQSELSFLQRLVGRQWRRNRTGARGLGLAASFSRLRPSPNALVHPL